MGKKKRIEALLLEASRGMLLRVKGLHRGVAKNRCSLPNRCTEVEDISKKRSGEKNIFSDGASSS